eukprot:5788127-Lingulodinium_polyedra.AAC.1
MAKGRAKATASPKKSMYMSPTQCKGRGAQSDEYISTLVKKTLRESFPGFTEYEIDSKVIEGKTLRQQLHYDRAEWLKQSDEGKQISLGAAYYREMRA